MTILLIKITLLLCCLYRISKLSRELSEINWLNEVNQKPKLRTYILIKKTLNPSEYVKSYMSKYKRSLMAQFLTGILPLNIETGRFKKIRDASSGKLRWLNSQERICEMCTLNEPEDEIHFLCSCTLYISFKRPLFDEATKFNIEFQSLPNTKKIIWLINNIWREVVNFLGGGPRVVVSTAAFHARVRGFSPIHVWKSVLWGASVTER